MRRTLYDKLWDSHVVRAGEGGEDLLYIDRQLVHEVSSPQAFRALADTGRDLRRPATHLAVADHAVPTRMRDRPAADPVAAAQIAELEGNARDFGVRYHPLSGAGHGIVHVIGPEQGFTLPGITLVCGDSHTTTHGAFGALAFGIGATECGTVMATQCLVQKRTATMRVDLQGQLPVWASAKDIALALIARIGAQGARGFAVEYAGPVVAALDMAGRMTLCNMTIEAGSRVGLIGPDETTFTYLEGRAGAPKGADWDRAVGYWRSLCSDAGATFDRVVTFDVSAIEPHVTWGTSPDQGVPVSGHVPDPDRAAPEAQAQIKRALDYMGLAPGMALADIPIDRVFIGSCTNSRIEDLRIAAGIVEGRKVAGGVRAMVVPGSAATGMQAEAEGLANIFRAAGFEWRDAGCSMCVAMNDDRLAPGERCASTSNRNFEGRQGQGGRTHLMSPASAAAAAITGRIADVRTLMAGTD
ncbi:3-isopropylmalate dehydratase large subunit [Blastomonas sp.]|uniref:3-isopropylmalate dehydratase large subunit n=1 Tax=Blastomonas sp. TaxID=1909299 RepID=UPI00263078D8|nr:3-isopropylmalate dehydratase large subunit [Blastomonas sp.]MDM7955895.1 3-isopropylmalate dehydratase large subunit [Blastomonas sp.]